jgi:hypothetical protein
MEDVILSIVKELLSVTIGFVALILTAYSILMTLPDTNWKIVKVKKSEQYKSFIKSISNLAIGFTGLFLYSVLILITKEYICIDYALAFKFSLYLYIVLLFILCINLIRLLLKFKKIIILSSDSTKPKLDMNKENEE